MHVAKERWEERNSCEGGAAVTEAHQEQGLVGVKGHHTKLLIEELKHTNEHKSCDP